MDRYESGIDLMEDSEQAYFPKCRIVVLSIFRSREVKLSSNLITPQLFRIEITFMDFRALKDLIYPEFHRENVF